MRIKIGSFIVFKEEVLVYPAPSGASYESFIAGAVRYLVSDNPLGNSCTACTAFIYFERHYNNYNMV